MLNDKTDVQYFSLLRPWSELRIVQEFCKHPQYFGSFTSCNENWKIAAKSQNLQGKLWWAVARNAHLPSHSLQDFFESNRGKIFGGNLFDSSALEPVFRELLGLQGFKPFECVGTPDEVSAAFLLTRKRGDLEDTAMMQVFEAEVFPKIKIPRR